MVHSNEDGQKPRARSQPLDEQGEAGRARDVREDIKAHATHLFARKGYAATSIREIAQAADVTNPMIYYYFKNKRGLFEAIISEALNEIDRLTEEITSTELSLRVVMESIFVLYFEHVTAKPDLARLFFKTFFLSDSAEMNEALRCHDERGRARWEQLVRRAQEKGEVRQDIEAEVLCMCLGGLMLEPIFYAMAGFPTNLNAKLARDMLGCFFEGAALPTASKPQNETH